MSHNAARAFISSFACCEKARVPYRARRGSASKVAPKLQPASDSSAAARSPSPVDATPVSATPLPRTEAAACQADALARSLCAARDRLTEPLARLAASLVAERAWCVMGFARASDFARERLGRSARWLRDLAALHRGLSTLAGLGAALTGEDAGAPIGRRRAFLVARVADASTLAAWVARARTLTVRELQAEVARMLRPDDSVSAASSPAMESMLTSPQGPPAHLTTSDLTAGDLEDDEDRLFVRIAAPRAIVASFDEAVDLYRAVEGADATVTSFVEALVAEASAAGVPAEGIDGATDDSSETRFDSAVGAASSAGGTPYRMVETALAKSTDRWRHLPRTADASWGLALGRSTLARLDAIIRAGVEGTAAERVARINELLAIENEIEIHLGRLLASMGEQDAWDRLRFAGMAHYAEERLGLSRTAARTRARAARVLGCFPLLRDAYEHDAIGLEAALLVGRVLSASREHKAGRRGHFDLLSRSDLESAWVSHAAEVTLKRLRDEERALGRFAAFCLGPESLAAAPPEDGDWQASLRREPGIARRRVAALGFVALGALAGPANLAAGEPAFNPATALIPEPDVFLRLTLPDDLASRFLAVIEATRRDLTRQAESIPWDAEWPSSETGAVTLALLAARTFSIRSRRIPAWIDLLAMLEDFVGIWDAEGQEASGATHRKGSANDLTTGASRRKPSMSREDAILVRDGWRCVAPACSSRRNLEVHHVLYRSRGGGDQEWNLVTLCRFHHQRGEHGGLARCEGRAPLGMTWKLGSGLAAAWYRNERRIASPAAVG